MSELRGPRAEAVHPGSRFFNFVRYKDLTARHPAVGWRGVAVKLMRKSDSPYLSILPKVETLYWAIRSLALLGLLFHMIVSTPSLFGELWWLIAASGFTALVAIPALLAKYARFQLDRYFWHLYSLDILAVVALVYLTGGIASNFYVLFYALVPYVGYTTGIHFGLAVAAIVTAVYAIPCVALGGLEVLPELIFRMVMMWIFTGVMGVANGIFTMFSHRLLNAMDKLNEYTSELERTSSQLETIYETSRSLAGLMPVENVIDSILGIARQVLRYPVCEIYTWDPVNKKLWLKGRINEDLTERLERPLPIEPSEAFKRVIRNNETVRVLDRFAGKPVVEGNAYRSQLIVPMISEGKLVGLLNAESPHPNAFTERDERVMSILADSSSMSLVNADLHQQMEKLTVVDELTGLFNFRHFRSRLEDEQRRAARYGTPLSLIMIDIDWFKSLNDRFGHQIGNVALCQLAKVITSCVRDVDVVARYGGEEFIVILPQTATEETHRIAERMRRKVEQTEFGPDATGRPLPLTVSIGVSCYPDNGRSEDDLVESVDQALYRAKGGGKNLVCTA